MNHTSYVSVKFLTELITVVALYILPYERRRHFWLKLPICLAVCYVFSYCTSPMLIRYHQWERLAVVAIDVLRYTAIFSAVALTVYFLFQFSFRASFFICAGAYAIQHMTIKLYKFIETLYIDRVSIPVLVVTYVGFLTVCYTCAYFLVIRRLQQHDDARLKADDTATVNILTVVSLIVINALAGDLSPVSVLGEIASVGYGMICGIFLLSLQMSIFNRGEIEQENEQIEYILEQERKQFESFRDGVDYLNIKCHDLKHQIHQLKQVSTIRADTITELEDSISRYESYSNTGFPALDIILGEKYLACKAKEIEFAALADGEKLSKLSESDIYSLFGNAIDNAIEYEERLPKGSRLIRLSIKDIGNMLFVRVENTYNGPDFASGELQTSKENKLYHGFGIKSMRHIVKKYGGEMDVNATNGLFCLTCMFIF